LTLEHAKIIYLLRMSKHPTLGIAGSKPRFAPSISQMLKEEEKPEPAPRKHKRKAGRKPVKAAK
jgi:hypothetical protein